MQSLRAGMNYVRRNPRRVCVYSVTGISACVATWYARKQYLAITATLDAERENGARALQNLHNGSSSTVESTLRALLPPGRERIFACDEANPDVLVARLKTVTDPNEKKAVWEQLKIASIVRLVASAYYLVEIYLILLLQVHLVARYSSTDYDAPVESLEGGKLGLESKQRFLSLARRRLFEQCGIEELVALVRTSTESVAGDMRLSEKIGPDDLRSLLRKVCRQVESRSGVRSAFLKALVPPKTNGVAGAQSENESETGRDSVSVRPSSGEVAEVVPSVLNIRQLFQPPADAEGDDIDVWDESVRQLALESLDLCDVLDYDGLLSESVDALLDVAGGRVDGYVWGVSDGRGGDGKAALASVVARLANISFTALGSAAPPEIGTGDDGPFVEALLHLQPCHAFGASVFLSGERTQH